MPLTNEVLKRIYSLIADDRYAMSFQSLGQYRQALLKEILDYYDNWRKRNH